MTFKRFKIPFKIPSPYDLIPIFILVMDILWIYAWLIGLTHLQQLNMEKPPMNLISYLLLVVGSYAITRFSVISKWSLKWARLGVVGFDIILVLLLVRLNLSGGYGLLDPGWLAYAGAKISTIIIGAGAGIFLIWRSLNVDRQSKEFSSIYRQFVSGLAALIFLLIVWGFANLESRVILSSVGIYAFSFFGLGLLTLAMVNLKSLQEKLSHHQEAITSFRRRWLSMLVLLVVALLMLAVALGSLLNSNLAAAIFHGIKVAADWIGDNILYLFYPIGFVVQLLSYILQYLLHLIRRQQPTEQNNFNMQEWITKLQESNNSNTPDYIIILVTILKWVVVALAVWLIIYLLWRSLRRVRQAKNDEGFDEENESMWTLSLLKSELKSFWNWLLGKMRRRKQPVQIETYVETAVVQNPASDNDLYDIRELYRAVLWQGRETGIPRRKEETPYEYLRRLENRSGESTPEIGHLTEAYVQARYGLVQTEPEKLKWLNRLWQALRSKISGQNSGS